MHNNQEEPITNADMSLAWGELEKHQDATANSKGERDADTEASMELMFLILCFVKGLRETEALWVTGEEGAEVTVTCSHSNAFNTIKYFCRGACRSEDVLTSSREEKSSNGKYSIEDEGNVFHVGISDLTKGDSGTYWCGVERVGLDTYTQVVLTVEGGRKSEASPDRLGYVAAVSVVPVFSLLAIALLVLARRRRRHIQASSGSGKHPGQKQEGHRITAPSAAAGEHEETDVGTEGGLLYSTVSFNEHGAAAPSPAAVVYATVTHRPPLREHDSF